MESIPTDVASWFASTAALSAVIIAAIAFLKKNVLKNLHDLATVAASLGLGVVAGVAGHLLGYLDTGLAAAAGFGLTAGFLASGGWDALASLLGKRGSAG
jgi:xanthine/uracil permease